MAKTTNICSVGDLIVSHETDYATIPLGKRVGDKWIN
jgi:hypothetical protein